MSSSPSELLRFMGSLDAYTDGWSGLFVYLLATAIEIFQYNEILNPNFLFPRDAAIM